MEMQCDFCYATSETEGYYFRSIIEDIEDWHFCCFVCAKSVIEPVILRFLQRKGKIVDSEKLRQGFTEAQNVINRVLAEEERGEE